jgi:general secretion pathway protein F
MPVYEYKALGKKGSTRTGIIDADTPRDARNKLRIEGIHVVSIKEIESRRRQSHILPRFLARRNISDLAMVTRQMATLIESGIQLREAIGALIDQVEDRHLQTTFRDLREKITSGKSFADALADHPFYFNPLYVNMVRAGEAAGNLETILNKIADYLQAQSRMQGKISAALAYPIVMMIIGILVVIFLMTFVVPKIQVVLEQQKQQLPLPTQILANTSHFIMDWWPLLLLE